MFQRWVQSVSSGCRSSWLPIQAIALALLMLATGAGIAEGVSGSIKATRFAIAGDATKTRVVMEFDQEPLARWFLLRSPHRMVIDLPPTAFAVDSKEMRARGLVREIRYGQVEEGRTRLILNGKGPFKVETFDIVQDEQGGLFRLSIDIAATSEREFDQALLLQADKTASTAAAKGDRLGTAPASVEPKPFTIVIDAGHGGIDGGANGVTGTVEKDITLTFARELKARLEQERRFRLIMTREEDVFVRLDDRVRIARQAGADLFISIHADSIRARGVNGATVYTVSDKASDEDARELAERENMADQIAGIPATDENRDVVDILAELVRRETHSFSLRFARTLVGQLSDEVEMIKNPHRQAGFRVLRAPDVPSVLIELGYLSDAGDEGRLNDPEWRRKAIESIYSAVSTFAGGRAGARG